MKVLTVQDYNEQVKAFFPYDWAQVSKDKGYVVIDDDFKNGAWGISKESATKKYVRYYPINRELND